MKSNASKINRYFLLNIFLALFVTGAIVFCMILMLNFTRVVEIDQHASLYTILMLLANTILGTIFATIFGRRIIRPFTELSKAAQLVATGDFSVQLDEHYPIREIRETMGNFNKMVRELGAIDMFRNDFISNVTHEFKTPIAAIEGYTMLLQDESLPRDELREYSEIIINSVHQLSILCDNVLQLSKLENQSIVQRSVTYRLDEQIRQAILMLEPQWDNKRLDFDIDLESCVFNGNEELLIQVWLNLIGNAVKFTPEGGRVRVSLSRSEHKLIVVISDSGIGMDENTIKHMYDKFYQGDTTHSSEGNGLGLPLVKRIVGLCGGNIEVQSKLGKGTAFNVELPYCLIRSTPNETDKKAKGTS